MTLDFHLCILFACCRNHLFSTLPKWMQRQSLRSREENLISREGHCPSESTQDNRQMKPSSQVTLVQHGLCIWYILFEYIIGRERGSQKQWWRQKGQEKGEPQNREKENKVERNRKQREWGWKTEASWRWGHKPKIVSGERKKEKRAGRQKRVRSQGRGVGGGEKEGPVNPSAWFWSPVVTILKEPSILEPTPSYFS